MPAVRATQQLRYSLYGIFDLAYHGGDRPVRLQEIGERQKIPARYLEQIFQRLRRAGLVCSKRGPGGGYVLARPPDQITLSEVVVAVEGAVLSEWSDGSGEEGLGFVWDGMRQSIGEALGKRTVGWMCREAAQRGIARESADVPSYDI